jgi:hypothetical protein
MSPVKATNCRKTKQIQGEITMKKFTLSFWLALAAAGFFVIQTAAPYSHKTHMDDPFPTCPPLCPPAK